MRTNTLFRSLAAGLAIAAASPAFADHYHGHGGPRRYYGPAPSYYGHAWYGGHWYHGWYGGSPGWWWVVGGTWFLYPAAVYPYPDPYAVPMASLPAPPPGPPSAPQLGPSPQQYWYWCGNPAGYYPYVSQCGQPWQAVAAGAPATAPESGPPPMPAPPQFPPPGAPGAAVPAPGVQP